MKTFKLVRETDVSGISGTGIVGEGVIFSDGRVAMRWLTTTATTVVFDCVEDVETIHGHGGFTWVEYDN
jgi:hypothetical protein